MLNPGIVLALYDGRTATRAVESSKALVTTLLTDAADGDLAVLDHSNCDDDSAVAHRTLRSLGVRRVWQGIPANALARIGRNEGITAAAQTAARWARWARAQGVEVVQLNGETGADPARDWDVDASVPEDAVFVRDLAREVFAAMASELRGSSTLIGFTSHDMPRHWRLAWPEILGPSSPVVAWSPQRYPADGTRPGREGYDEAHARCLSTDRQWTDLAARGVVRLDLAPGGAGYAPYAQLHGLTVAAVVRLLDAPTALGWAAPLIDRDGRADDHGVTALRAVLRMRRAVGTASGLAARWQTSRMLTADGRVGATTLAALGLRVPV